MTDAARFLTALAQAFSTMTLYEEGHPARERAVDHAHERLLVLHESEPRPDFTFVGSEIVFGNRPLRELRAWDWGRRLADVGIQRLELAAPVERADLEFFLEQVLVRLTGEGDGTAESRPSRPTQIRYGAVGIRDAGGAPALEETPDGDAEPEEEGAPGYDLGEEVRTVGWLHEELKGGRELHLLEAGAVVRSLSVAMHGDRDFLIPLLRLKRFDQYTTTHALNVSVLSMALAEYIGLGPAEVRSFGTAGLLHDLGKVTIPDEILNKPGKLTDEERAVMNAHPVEGARIILETRDRLELAAVVAYEHHVRLDGGGYPSFRYPRACHQASDLVHVCDVFDALRTHRPYRAAWERERVLGYIEDGAGSEFDPDLARAFVRMMRRWGERIASLEAEDAALPMEGGG